MARIPIDGKQQLIFIKKVIITPGSFLKYFHVSKDENGTLRNSRHDGYNFGNSMVKGNESSLNPPQTPRNDHASNDSIDSMRESLLEKYPDHKHFITQSDLFRPSSKSYFDVPEDESRNVLLRCHRMMTRLREMDDILLNAQRQGRISFYLTCRGEEGMTIGSASALRDSDVLLSQYREQGIFMWRGFTLDQFTNQVCA
jgi:hypothetical protein